MGFGHRVFLDDVPRATDGEVTVTVGSLDIVSRIWFSLSSITVTAPLRLDTRLSSIMERKESTDDEWVCGGGVLGSERLESVEPSEKCWIVLTQKPHKHTKSNQRPWCGVVSGPKQQLHHCLGPVVVPLNVSKY